MTDASLDISVSENRGAHRYEATVEGVPAGTCQYELAGRIVTFTHTVVDPAYEGRGVGSALARRALDDARKRGLGVVPACRFIAAYIERHPDDAALVVSGRGDGG